MRLRNDNAPSLMSERQKLRRLALSRWDSDGGGQAVGFRGGDDSLDVPDLTNTELVQLRVRVIALENLVIALLAEASDAHRELARDMAAYISPRPGFTPHPMTIHAAVQMLHCVDRAELFRATATDDEV